MRDKSIYPQLQFQLYMKHMNSKDLSEAVAINYITLRQKLCGKHDFNLREAIRIKNALCTDIPLEKLFATGEGIEP